MTSSFKTLTALLATTFLTAPAWAETSIPGLEPTVSGYTLSPTEAEGNNTITLYEVNSETGELTAKYYTLGYQTEYGDGENAKYYKWNTDGQGAISFVETTADDAEIIAHYGETSERVTTYSQGGDIEGNFVDISTFSSGGAVQASYPSFSDISGNFYGNSGFEGGAVYNGSGSTINGNFIGNHSIYMGGAISSGGVTSSIDGNFIGNSTPSYGGAIYNQATVGSISGSFVKNYTNGKGGAIDNMGIINSITANFIGNRGINGGAIYAEPTLLVGGVNLTIRTPSTISGITGDFIDNAATNGSGGAIYAEYSNLGNITGNFINNSATSNGGAIYATDNSNFGNITGDFIGNSANGGAAIYAENSTFGDISGTFINNIGGSLGAIYAQGTSTINSISGKFIGNQSSMIAGVIGNDSTINSVSGDFIGNSAMAGGAISNGGTINLVTANFINNSSSSYGGAIFTNGVMNIVNSNFSGNHVDGDFVYGGAAVFSAQDLNISADNGTSLFENNTVNGESNAVYMSSFTGDAVNLNLSAVNGGTLTFNDDIDGENYSINITGDGSGSVVFAGNVKNVNTLGLGNNSITHLGINGQINAQNMNIAPSAVLSPTADNSPIITVDVEVDKANNTVNAGAINIAGDISGDYRVLVNSLNPDVLDNTEDAVVPFLFAPADDNQTASNFTVARVIGSPYLWDGSINAEGETQGSTWYLNLTDEENPDYEPEPGPEPEPQVITPEVAAALGLHEAAIEQTRSLTRNIRNKIAATRGYCPGCGIYPHAWDGKTLRNVWVLAQGETANIEKPVDMDAKIWGVEAGFDIQNDVNNTLGVFASYRKGEYDLSGKTSRYARTTGSEIDIDSWLGGLYYRYDRNMNWLFATVYGGVQKAKAKTDDGIAKFKTDGVELGASAEIGHTFALNNSLTLDPSLGIFYTQVDFDKAHDNVGKKYDWKTIKHLEAELGAKLTKQFSNASIYAKPSVIQTFTGDDRVKVTGLGKADTYHDQTLGRIEVGGDYNFTDKLTGYTWANYTFGSSYDAFAGGLGLNYAW